MMIAGMCSWSMDSDVDRPVEERLTTSYFNSHLICKMKRKQKVESTNIWLQLQKKFFVSVLKWTKQQ